VIARIPEGSDYRPDPKSRTAGEIAWQIFCEETMLIDALESGKAEWAPAAAPATIKEMVDRYDSQSADIVSRLKALPAARWDGTLEFLRQPASCLDHGVELPVRHRAPPRPDLDLPAADGSDRAADLRTQWRRAVIDVCPRRAAPLSSHISRAAPDKIR
jgi:hypothetical protein